MFLSVRALVGLLVLMSGIAISGVHGKIITGRDDNDDNYNNTTGPDLTDCLVSRHVPYQVPFNIQFPGLNEPFNLRLNYTPVAIALPSTPQQVSDAVICASAAHVPVQARSGGHSYASFSSGGQNGSFVINLELFQDISVDPNTMIAHIGGGVRLGNLALGLYEYGGLKRAVPHGTCPGVGIGGHFTHGGYGYDSRMWGLALDTIVALDAVLANGSIIHATNASYPDVYFALRGAADSFGIVTSFYLQTQPAPAQITVFQIPVPAILESAEVATSSFLHLQDFATNSSLIDRRLTFGVYISYDANTGWTFNISGMFFGDVETFNSTVYQAITQTLPKPSTPRIQYLTWLDSLLFFSGGPLNQPLTGYGLHDTFAAKSIVAQESHPLTATALTSYFSYILSHGPALPGWFSIINLYGGPGSAINAVPLNSSAYAHRSSLWVFQHYASSATNPEQYAPFPPSTLTFLAGLNSALENAQPDGDFAAYANYVDPTYSADEAHALYYGAQLTATLEAIKRAADPGNVFSNPQGFLPSTK